MKFYVREQLGATQAFTPEGFLVCMNVPIARTGEQIYGPNETTVDAGDDGVVHINRTEEEVFRPETIASFNGKPVVWFHPDTDVNPDNWKDLPVVGSVMNTRRGAGESSNYLLADFMIIDAEAINAIRERNLREVSCGYAADYFETKPGYADQRNIIGNHVALVEQGRCGPRCAIGDGKPNGGNMNKTWTEKLWDAFKHKDEGKFKEALEEAPKDPATHIHVHTADGAVEEEKKEKKETMDAAIDARFKTVEDKLDGFGKDMKSIKDALDKKAKDESEEAKEKEEKEKAKKSEDEAILGSLEMEAPPGTGDKAKSAKDSAYLADSFQETVALAEVITPGIPIPVFDHAAEPKATVKSMCGFRRTVLDLAYNQPETRVFMDGLLGGRDIKQYTCDGVRTVFLAVGAFKKQQNNKDSFADRTVHGTSGGNGVKGTIKSPADYNKRLKEFYAGK